MSWLSHKYFLFYSRLKYGFHPKPSYLLRTLRNLFLVKVLGRFVLRGVDFAITYKCNFNCDHCYAKRLFNKNRRTMGIKDYKRICQEAMDLGATVFSLQGGEVFLHPKWREIVKVFQPNMNHVIITTNGSLLDEEKIREVKDLGVDCLYFSIDSGIAEEHDRFRKRKGNFTKIMGDIEICKKIGLKVVILTCMSRFNARSEGLKKLFDYSHKNRILLCTILARPLGNWEGNYDSLLRDEDLEFYEELRKDYPFVVRENENNYGKKGCLAVKEYIYVTEYGDVCPCPFTHIVLGNVFEESLKTIRDRGLKTKWWSYYHPVCLTARDEEFMGLYYPLVNDKPLVKLEEFKK